MKLLADLKRQEAQDSAVVNSAAITRSVFWGRGGKKELKEGSLEGSPPVKVFHAYG